MFFFVFSFSFSQHRQIWTPPLFGLPESDSESAVKIHYGQKKKRLYFVIDFLERNIS